MNDAEQNPDGGAEIAIGPAQGSVIVGERHQSDNAVTIPMSNRSSSDLKVQLIVRVRFGAGEDALLRAEGDPLTLTARFGSNEVPLQRTGSETGTDRVVWTTAAVPRLAPTLGGASTATIKLSQIRADSRPGKALVSVAVRVHDGDAWIPDDPAQATGEDVGIEKVQAEGEAPVIDYFRVEPDFLLGAAENVTISFHGRNFATYTLFRNNQPVTNWVGDGEHVFSDKPSLTTVYRLLARPEEPDQSATTLYRTVQVIAPGWNQVALPQGYPTQLFVHKHFGGEGDLRLYGVFRQRSSEAALYSSRTGIDDWRHEAPLLHEMTHMADSPGVAFDDRLWLIGGSSYDEDARRSEVWCYTKVHPEDPADTTRTWQRADDLPMKVACHTCLVVPHPEPQIWLVGGIEDGNEHFDRVIVMDAAGTWTVREDLRLPEGRGRRHVAATAYRSVRSGAWRPCVYGGIAVWGEVDVICTDMLVHPIEGDETAPAQEPESAARQWQPEDSLCPHQGYPLAAALVATPSVEELEQQGVDGLTERQRIFLVGTFILPEGDDPPETLPLMPPPKGASGPNVTVSRIYEWMPDGKRWEAREVEQGWETFGGAWFRMHAISFNRFLFVWSLGYSIKTGTEPKLNVLVPR